MRRRMSILPAQEPLRRLNAWPQQGHVSSLNRRRNHPNGDTPPHAAAHCGTLLLYQTLELRGSGFRIMSLTWVELWGFEPQTSCMPSSGNPSTRVHSRRPQSRSVHPGPPASRPVAVLPCCTTRRPLHHEPSTWTPNTPHRMPQRRVAPGPTSRDPCCHAPTFLICHERIRRTPIPNSHQLSI
jgi:hypothetical protein